MSKAITLLLVMATRSCLSCSLPVSESDDAPEGFCSTACRDTHEEPASWAAAEERWEWDRDHPEDY